MDVLALPTYREGFPNVPLEAAAAGVPVVTTTATGAVDSIRPGTTGILVPVGDHKALANALELLIADPFVARSMGEAGRKWVTNAFRPEELTDQLVLLLAEELQRSKKRKA